MIAMNGTNDESCWLAGACKILLLLLLFEKEIPQTFSRGSQLKYGYQNKHAPNAPNAIYY